MSPDLRPAPTVGWHITGEPYAVDLCREGKWLRAEFPNVSIGATATPDGCSSAPPGIVLGNYELFRAARIGIGTDMTSRAYALYHDAANVEAPWAQEFCVSFFTTCFGKGDFAATEILDPDNRIERTGL